MRIRNKLGCDNKKKQDRGYTAEVKINYWKNNFKNFLRFHTLNPAADLLSIINFPVGFHIILNHRQTDKMKELVFLRNNF